MNKLTERSDLLCSECGNIFPIQRKKSSKRSVFHIKNLYCIKCKEITKHIELQDAYYIKSKLEYQQNLNKLEQYLKELLEKNNKTLILTNGDNND